MPKIILDEGVPESLLYFLHKPKTVKQEGWRGKKNGELLKLCATRGYEIFITLDTKMEFQQNLDKYAMRVIVLRGKTNRLEDLRPLFSKVLNILDAGMKSKKITVTGKSKI